ncbi:transcriptional adapter ADA2b-like isoform X2 [Silene latifolia]|uniref:transcriptional adapter ADA2b-like isoform X2 n=1 Tax=Silene latifolia TaxID=37657 RepID=UPI003D7826BE
MGRSRAIPNSNDDDPSLRSKRKKAPSGADNVESVTAGSGMPRYGQDDSNDGNRALYHCNYCNKDITEMIRIKCATCTDFDLCIECLSVGAEVHPHKSDHPYRVMDNLSFPLICPDWNADEEILLLEGIDMYGLSNWAEVGEHVGTKSKSECIEHYNSVYMNSPCFPLPDLSHVVGKKREELQAMGREHNELQKSLEEVSFKEAPPSEKVNIEEQRKEAFGGQSFQPDTPSDRKLGEKKPKIDDGPSVTDLSGYNPKRKEFEVEYDNDAEQLVADMEFKDIDTEAERQLKLNVVKIYNRRLDERKRRKDFIIERNILYPDPFEKNLSPEERQICQQYRVFMRFHSKEEHEELLKTVIEEHRILKRIQDLKEAKTAGCRTSSEAEIYIRQKRKREAEENARKMKDTIEGGSGGKGLLRTSHPREFGIKDSSSTAPEYPTARSLDDWDVSGFQGADLLTETEKGVCREIRILPSHYLSMLQTMSTEVMKGNISTKSDAHRFLNVEPSKVDRVYDMLVQKGIAPP